MLENLKFKLFIKLLVIFLCVFLIPFIIFGTILSQYLISNYKNEILNLNLNTTNYIRYVIDESLSEVDGAKLIIADNSEVKDFVSRENISETEKPYLASKVSKEISNYYVYKDAIAGLHLYAFPSNCIITDSSIYTKEEYYDSFLKNSDIDFDRWVADMHSPGSDLTRVIPTVDINGTKTAIIIQPLIEDKAALLILLDADNILEIYQRIASDVSESYFAITSESEILIQSGNMPFEPDVKMLLEKKEEKVSLPGNYAALCGKSIISGLNYICIMSETSILNKVNRTNTYLIICIIIMSVILTFIAFFVSNKTFSPIKTLINLIEPENTHQINTVEEVQNLVVNIANSDRMLRDVINKQQKCINENMFRLFVQNSMELDGETLNMLFSGMPVSLNASYYRAVIVQIQDNKSSAAEILNLNIISILQDKLRKYDVKYCIIPSDSKQHIMLFAYNKHDEIIKPLFERIVANTSKNGSICISVSIGREINSLNLFSKSYEDAFFIHKPGKNNVVCYADGKTNPQGEYFDFIERDRLILYLCAGNTVSAEEILTGLQNKIFVESTSTYRLQNYIRYWLCEVFKEVINEIGYKDSELARYYDECMKALESNRFEESFSKIADCCLKVSDYVKENSSKNSANLIDEVINYVNEKYWQPDISLKRIADEMHISYNYLSDAFKKQTGKTFLDYLHGLRNNYAKNLLVTTDAAISEIAEKTGYLSSNTFIKTFKKLNGITPGEFRRIKKK